MIVLELFLFCLLFTAVVKIFVPHNAIEGLFFYPASVQERVIAMGKANRAQIKAFAKGFTPYPKWCWVFSLPVGMLAAMVLGQLGNTPICNTLSCAWIAIGNLWMFGGLLAAMKCCKAKAG